MSEHNRNSGIVVGSVLAVSLSLAACATHKPATTTPPTPANQDTAEQSQPGVLPPPFHPPFANPVDPDKGKKKQGGDTSEPAAPALE